jgi:hypothetical protein
LKGTWYLDTLIPKVKLLLHRWGRCHS